jgi:hypothetical protein
VFVGVLFSIPAYAWNWGTQDNDRESRYYSAADFKREMGVKESARVQEKNVFEKLKDRAEQTRIANHNRVAAIEYGIVLPKAGDYSFRRTFDKTPFAVPSKGVWLGSFDIRNTYRGVEHEFSPTYIRVEPKDLTKTASFVLRDNRGIAALRAAKSVDLYVHGFNTGPESARDFFTEYVRLMNNDVGHRSSAALLSWSGDVGGATGFNQAVQSSRYSANGVANVMAYLHEQNQAMRINVVTYSLGARLILNAAAEGVKFDRVIMMVPAVDDDELADTQRFSAAIQNIAHLTIVFSKNQQSVFGAYAQARFTSALGLNGAIGRVTHPSVQIVDASKAANNRWQMEINNHGDIHERETLLFLKEMLEKKEDLR